ncbi:MAG TPA: T9SS type A sorting domain-containing protein [Bacteroidales bacterium]|nr:T9SS type A sorting domain-containing protein [Bacteroidales bacterium]
MKITSFLIIISLCFVTKTYAQDNIVQIWLNDSTILSTQPFNHYNEIYWGPPVDITVGGGAYSTSGFNNTNDIVAQLGDNGGQGYAALICDTLTAGGFSDWYLPTGFELITMIYKADSIGGITSFYSENTSYVWTSSEWSDTIAFCLVFGLEMWQVNKNELANVRCVRRDTVSGISSIADNAFKITFNNGTRELYVSAFNGLGNIKIAIYDANGKQMFTKTSRLYASSSGERISLSAFTPGVYIVKVLYEGKSYTDSIIIY